MDRATKNLLQVQQWSFTSRKSQEFRAGLDIANKKVGANPPPKTFLLKGLRPDGSECFYSIVFRRNCGKPERIRMKARYITGCGYGSTGLV
jgi:hypothetical protein